MLAATAGAASIGSVLTAETQPSAHQRHIKAVAFDGFVIFDPRPVVVQVEKEFPGRGAEFTNLWRTRQFEYTWLRTLMGRYEDFLGASGKNATYRITALDGEGRESPSSQAASATTRAL